MFDYFLTIVNFKAFIKIYYIIIYIAPNSREYIEQASKGEVEKSKRKVAA